MFVPVATFFSRCLRLSLSMLRHIGRPYWRDLGGGLQARMLVREQGCKSVG